MLMSHNFERDDDELGITSYDELVACWYMYTVSFGLYSVLR